MIIVNLNKLNIPYVMMPFSFVDRSLNKHCNEIECNNCKYKKPLENCRISYVYGHNLVRMGYSNKYIIISDEERHLLYNQNIYCCNNTASCDKCRYDSLIYNENGSRIECTIGHIIAHRIIKGEITQDQYEIREVHKGQSLWEIETLYYRR